MRWTTPIIMFALVANLLFAALIYWRSNTETGGRVEMQRQLDRLEEAVQRVHISYVDADRALPEPLVESALRGMLSELDENSRYLDNNDYARMQGESEGQISGLGIEVTSNEGQLTIVTPIEGTPAARAGLLPGDRILEIDGESTSGMNLSDAVRLIQGKPETAIDLKVKSLETESPHKVQIVREIITVPSVIDVHHAVNGIGYLRITDFTAKTGVELSESIELLRKEQALHGLIIDLRGNPGGLLVSALQVAEQFVSAGTLVVYTQGREASDHSQYFAEYDDPDLDLSLVVLVNPFSASASEVVAGALQDEKRATVIGQRSYGKGSVQTVIPLEPGPDSPAIRLTTAKYYTKSGRVIHGVGIAPDIEIEIEKEEWRRILTERSKAGTAGDGQNDPQLRRAIEVLVAEIPPATSATSATSAASVVPNKTEVPQ